MHKRRVGIVDLVTKAPTRSVWSRIMNPNFAGVMPSIVATWSDEGGHDTTLVVYTGFEDIAHELPKDTDIVFISAFSHSAQLAYALSNMLRSEGTVTVLGGPHARSYPHDAVQYFDYVLGFTDQQLVDDVIEECRPNRPIGQHLSAGRHPASLPTVRERWKFIEQTLAKAPLLKIVNTVSSLGCPYTCSFCVDSVVPYQPLDVDGIKEDLRFLRTKFKRPKVGWYDPNFGVRFDEILSAIEDSGPIGSIDFFSETSLSLLNEGRLQRLQRNSFKAVLPGVESWFDLGVKSRTGRKNGYEKVDRVAEQINMVLKYIPYLQANFVFGLDVDEGPEPFECTKRFVDLSPGAYPAYCQLSAFGESAPLNLQFQEEGRLLPFPFHFLTTQEAMNVRPKNYTWPEFYRLLGDLTEYTFSRRAIYRRYRANRSSGWSWMNVLRGMTRQGRGRVAYYRQLVDRLERDRPFRAFFEQETTELPKFYEDKIRQDLGPFWEWLPAGAVHHDHLSFLKHSAGSSVPTATPGIARIQRH